MPTPEIVAGEGTKLEMKITTTFVEIGLVYEIDGPGVKVTVVPTDHLTSTVMTTRPGKIPDPDTASIKIWMDPSDTAMHQVLIDRCNAPGTIDDFQITFNDDNTTHAKATFSGFFTGFKFNGMKNQENVGADLEIKLTTIVELTAGS